MDVTLVSLFSDPTAFRYGSADRRFSTRRAVRSVRTNFPVASTVKSVHFADDDRGASVAEMAKVHAACRGQPVRHGVGPADRMASEAQQQRAQEQPRQNREATAPGER